MKSQSPDALDGEIITIRKGVAIYKVHRSHFYRARIWDPKYKKYVVKSTKETSRIRAREAAEELYNSLSVSGRLSATPEQYTFKHFAKLVLEQAQHDVTHGRRRSTHIKDTRGVLNQNEWGLVPYFGDMDIREIQTKDFVAYVRTIERRRSDLSHSTFAQMKVVFRRVLKIARDDGLIQFLPETPTFTHKKQIPRTFFRFHPLVSRDEDEWKRLIKAAADIVEEPPTVLGKPITIELRDMVLFLLHSFMRPTYSELYSLKHSDITFRAPDKKNKNAEEWLLLTIRAGKTGRRLTDTMPAAAAIYRRILSQRKNWKPEDYVFFPEHQNRHYATKVGMYQFRKLLEIAGLQTDAETGRRHSLYSVRHTSLAMRVLLSEGRTNLLVLAQNAGTSIEMLSKFYLNNLPRTSDVVRNLQSFGDS
jgi:hypothetical protein